MSDTKDLEAEIEQTRQQLGQTVEALSDKLDVKSSASDAKDQAVETVSSNWREIAVVATWAALVTIVWRKF